MEEIKSFSEDSGNELFKEGYGYYKLYKSSPQNSENLSKALSCFKKAAETGNVKAAVNVVKHDMDVTNQKKNIQILNRNFNKLPLEAQNNPEYQKIKGYMIKRLKEHNLDSTQNFSTHKSALSFDSNMVSLVGEEEAQESQSFFLLEEINEKKDRLEDLETQLREKNQLYQKEKNRLDELKKQIAEEEQKHHKLKKSSKKENSSLKAGLEMLKKQHEELQKEHSESLKALEKCKSKYQKNKADYENIKILYKSATENSHQVVKKEKEILDLNKKLQKANQELAQYKHQGKINEEFLKRLKTAYDHDKVPLPIAAIDKGDVKSLQALVKAGYSPNQPDNAGNTCLHHACLKSNETLTFWLIEIGRADVYVANTQKQLPLETSLLMENKNFRCASILSRHMAHCLETQLLIFNEAIYEISGKYLFDGTPPRSKDKLDKYGLYKLADKMKLEFEKSNLLESLFLVQSGLAKLLSNDASSKEASHLYVIMRKQLIEVMKESSDKNIIKVDRKKLNQKLSELPGIWQSARSTQSKTIEQWVKEVQNSIANERQKFFRENAAEFGQFERYQQWVDTLERCEECKKSFEKHTLNQDTKSYNAIVEKMIFDFNQEMQKALNILKSEVEEVKQLFEEQTNNEIDLLKSKGFSESILEDKINEAREVLKTRLRILSIGFDIGRNMAAPVSEKSLLSSTSTFFKDTDNNKPQTETSSEHLVFSQARECQIKFINSPH